MPLATRALARKVLDFTVEDLTERIRSARQSTATAPASEANGENE